MFWNSITRHGVAPCAGECRSRESSSRAFLTKASLPRAAELSRVGPKRGQGLVAPTREIVKKAAVAAIVGMRSRMSGVTRIFCLKILIGHVANADELGYFSGTRTNLYKCRSLTVKPPRWSAATDCDPFGRLAIHCHLTRSINPVPSPTEIGESSGGAVNISSTLLLPEQGAAYICRSFPLAFCRSHWVLPHDRRRSLSRIPHPQLLGSREKER